MGNSKHTIRPTSLEDGQELEEFLDESRVALVEFYTDGCGICQSMEPVIGNVAKELEIPVATLNPRNDPPLIEEFNVRSVPLFVIFLEGEPIARLADGFVPGQELSFWIESEITD